MCKTCAFLFVLIRALGFKIYITLGLFHLDMWLIFLPLHSVNMHLWFRNQTGRWRESLAVCLNLAIPMTVARVALEQAVVTHCCQTCYKSHGTPLAVCDVLVAKIFVFFKIVFLFKLSICCKKSRKMIGR